MRCRHCPERHLLVIACAGMVGKPPLEVELPGRRARGHDVVCPALKHRCSRRRERHRIVDGLGMPLHQAGFGFEVVRRDA
jgi:hypothetical protein